MKKYKVLRTCVGYKGRYWEKDQVVDFDDDDTPPHHFALVDSSVAEQPNDGRPDPMKPQPVVLGKPIKPVGGFAAEHKFDLPEETVTAGKALKKNKK